MRDAFTWRTAWKIAWREGRASSAKFLFVILAVAVGVGSLTGVRGFSQAFRGMLLREARTLMAADLSVRTFVLPNSEQAAAMESLAQRGVARTWITETVSMLSLNPQSTPVLVSIKAVDPKVYPFYGKLKLDPPAELWRALTPDAVAVSEDLLMRFDMHVGDRVRLGEEEFRIAGVVIAEPDRMTGSLNVGPRILLSRAALDRTGLMVVGSRASNRFLFRIPPDSVPVAEVRQELRRVFTDALITDYRETHPLITRGLERATIFLSLVSLVALIVGAMGVAMAMHSHLQQKMDGIAVMKSLGARSGQIIRIYIIQTLGMGLIGGLAGVALGLAVQRVFPVLIERYFQIDPGVRWDLLSALQGLAIGLLTTLLFTLPPLIGIRRVKPNRILRREMEQEKIGWRERLFGSKSALAAGGALLFGIGLIAWWLSDSPRTGVFFIAGCAISVMALSGVAYAMLIGLRFTSRIQLPTTLRHGIANIYRPGNQASALLVALGLGVMFTLTIYLVQHSVIQQFAASAPPGMPNVFLLNITAKENDGVREILSRRAGAFQLVPLVSARISTVDGEPIQDRGLKGWERRYEQTRNISWSVSKPPQTEINEGAWWNPKSTAERDGVLVSAAEDTAKTLKLHVGSHIVWNVGAKTVSARVAAVHHNGSVGLSPSMEFILNPGALDGLPTAYIAGARFRPIDVPGLQREFYQRYPTVTVINAADVLAIVQDVVDQIALVIRFVSFFAILGGLVILASSVAGTRFRRVREVVILKTLGATRGKVAAIFSVEFLILGAAAGLMGGLLATGFSFIVLERLFKVNYRFDAMPQLVAIAAAALLANGAGWLASFRILGQKPLEALRDE